MLFARRVGAVGAIVLGCSPACGGKAIIDELGAGGAGAGGGSSQGGSPLCVTAEPVGALVSCGGLDGPDHCIVRVCDEAGQSWESDCQGQACQCRFNSVLRCTCVINEDEGTFCGGGVPSCCPTPFPE